MFDLNEWYVDGHRLAVAMEHVTLTPADLDRYGVHGVDIVERAARRETRFAVEEISALALALGVSFDWLTGAVSSSAPSPEIIQSTRETLTKIVEDKNGETDKDSMDKEPNTQSLAYVLTLAIIRRKADRKMLELELTFRGAEGDSIMARIESGDRGFSVFELVALADALQVSLEWLMGRSENPDPTDDESFNTAALLRVMSENRGH